MAAPASPQLYLITPPLDDAEAFSGPFEAALSATPIACAMIKLATPDEGTAKKIIRALSAIARAHDTALLVEGSPQMAVRADADGIHLRCQSETLERDLDEALQTLKPDRIVGAGLLKSKHDSMTAGERDIDYLMFGEPTADGYVPPFDQTLERVTWWAEIFKVPCVAYAGELDHVKQLADAGADFVALGDLVWADARGPTAALGEVHTLLKRKAKA